MITSYVLKYSILRHGLSNTDGILGACRAMRGHEPVDSLSPSETVLDRENEVLAVSGGTLARKAASSSAIASSGGVLGVVLVLMDETSLVTFARDGRV
jgi:hypothetical protein